MKNCGFKFCTIFLYIVFLISCSNKSGNTTTGNPLVGLAITNSSSAATVQFIKKPTLFCLLNWVLPSVFAFPAPNSMLDHAGNAVTVQSFWMNIGEIEFKTSETADAGEIDGTDIGFAGNYVIDLLSSSPQVIGYNTVTVSTIRRIKMKLTKTNSPSTTAPSGLNGNSIFIQGQVNGNQFVFSSTEESEFQVSGPQAVTAEANKNILLEFKAANLIKKIDFSSVNISTVISESNRVSVSNPCPQIDSSATDLYTCFRKGLESETNLGRDDNGDYKIDAGEEAVH
ncbi:MAG: hypothetical protein ACXVCN_19495 [Bdellovibrio sp.]